eukprot:TRINITY_DN6841_c1_g1_i2.p2 TRINITY_DN6841_c1_g1~~TRINITY_DN6841_c1_g1_i2.p2  ORF type:complete len:127 (-),score=2.95 TRINITY_DN6841_c1_g1_i2:370-750(-)
MVLLDSVEFDLKEKLQLCLQQYFLDVLSKFLQISITIKKFLKSRNNPEQKIDKQLIIDYLQLFIVIYLFVIVVGKQSIESVLLIVTKYYLYHIVILLLQIIIIINFTYCYQFLFQINNKNLQQFTF